MIATIPTASVCRAEIPAGGAPCGSPEHPLRGSLVTMPWGEGRKALAVWHVARGAQRGDPNSWRRWLFDTTETQSAATPAVQFLNPHPPLVLIINTPPLPLFPTGRSRTAETGLDAEKMEGGMEGRAAGARGGKGREEGCRCRLQPLRVHLVDAGYTTCQGHVTIDGIVSGLL